MFSHKEALDLSSNIILEIEKGKKITELLPEILRLSKIIKDNELEKICLLEISGYNISPEINHEKLNYYGLKVGRTKYEVINGKLEQVNLLKDSLSTLEDGILNYKGSKDWRKIAKIAEIMNLKAPIEAYFINKVNEIHSELKEYYPQKIIDEYLTGIINKLNDINPNLLDKIKSVYDSLYSPNKANLLNVPDLARKILVELGDLLLPLNKIQSDKKGKFYLLNNGTRLEIKDNDRNFKNKIVVFVHNKIISEDSKENILSELNLLSNNIIKFSDIISKLSHQTEINDSNIKSITSIAIRLIVVIGDILSFY